MAYTKQTWQDLPSKTTPINASRLGHIEQGIYDAASTADTAASNASSALSGLDDKVDKVTGKGLSTNDFTDALQTKLSNIAEGAEVNVQSDWNQSDNSADDYIKNKPTLGTASSKNSTSVVTQSTDLVESGAVFDVVKGSVGFVTTGKNILPNNAQSTGIFTVNADKSVTINGSSGSSFKQLELDMDIPVNIGTEYILSDGVSEPNNNIYIRLGKANDSYYGSTGTGDFRFTSTESKVTAKVFVSANQTVDNLTLKPMLRLATVTDDTYEPYHASVADSLAEKCDNSVIGTVEDGTTASQAYAVGSHAIRNGAFITWKNAKAQGETINDVSDYTSGDVAEALSGNPSKAISTTGYTQSNYELVSSECIKNNGKVFIVANFKVLNTTSNYISVAKLPDFAKPPLRLSTTSVSYDGGFDGVPLQFDITTAGVINLRGGVNNMRYPLVLSY